MIGRFLLSWLLALPRLLPKSTIVRSSKVPPASRVDNAFFGEASSNLLGMVKQYFFQLGYVLKLLTVGHRIAGFNRASFAPCRSSNSMIAGLPGGASKVEGSERSASSWSSRKSPLDSSGPWQRMQCSFKNGRAILVTLSLSEALSEISFARSVAFGHTIIYKSDPKRIRLFLPSKFFVLQYI